MAIGRVLYKVFKKSFKRFMETGVASCHWRKWHNFEADRALEQEGSSQQQWHHQRAALPVSSSSCDLFGLCFHSYLPENCPIDKKNEAGSGTGCYTMMSGKLWLIFFQHYWCQSLRSRLNQWQNSRSHRCRCSAAAIHFRNGAWRRQTPIAQLVRYGDCSRQQ